MEQKQPLLSLGRDTSSSLSRTAESHERAMAEVLMIDDTLCPQNEPNDATRY
jgi:hypothetical protein